MSTPAQDVALDALCDRMQKIRQQAEIVELFIGDRELLDCTHCGLQEDVLIVVADAKLTQGQNRVGANSRPLEVPLPGR